MNLILEVSDQFELQSRDHVSRLQKVMNRYLGRILTQQTISMITQELWDTIYSIYDAGYYFQFQGRFTLVSTSEIAIRIDKTNSSITFIIEPQESKMARAAAAKDETKERNTLKAIAGMIQSLSYMEMMELAGHFDQIEHTTDLKWPEGIIEISRRILLK